MRQSILSLLLTLIFMACPISVIAFEESYSVQGTDESGKIFTGAVYGIPGNRQVSGNLTDNNGYVHSFYGYIYNYCKIVGETDDGYSLLLHYVKFKPFMLPKS